MNLSTKNKIIFVAVFVATNVFCAWLVFQLSEVI